MTLFGEQPVESKHESVDSDGSSSYCDGEGRVRKETNRLGKHAKYCTIEIIVGLPLQEVTCDSSCKKKLDGRITSTFGWPAIVMIIMYARLIHRDSYTTYCSIPTFFPM